MAQLWPYPGSLTMECLEGAHICCGTNCLCWCHVEPAYQRVAQRFTNEAEQRVADLLQQIEDVQVFGKVMS